MSKNVFLDVPIGVMLCTNPIERLGFDSSVFFQFIYRPSAKKDLLYSIDLKPDGLIEKVSVY